jgi:hypothetical protein
VRREKNRLNGFSWARSWFTALKRGVNEMISTEQFLEQIRDGQFFFFNSALFKRLASDYSPVPKNLAWL